MDIKNNRSAKIKNRKYTSGKSESLLEVVVVVVVELSVEFVLVVNCHAVESEFASYPSGQELTQVKLCKRRGLVHEVHVVCEPEQVAHTVHASQDPETSTSPEGHDVTHDASSSI